MTKTDVEHAPLYQARRGRVDHVDVPEFGLEDATIEELHAAIAAAGLRPRGRHHDIHLSDPRRCPPERLRTILRQPVEPADEPVRPAGQGG